MVVVNKLFSSLLTEKGKVKVAQLCPTPCNPMDYTVHAYSPSIRVGSPSPGDLPNPGIKPRSPELQADSLPAEPPGKPKNTGVGILSLLQQIFLTHELNWRLLHCRRILHQLSYQGSPLKEIMLKWGQKAHYKYNSKLQTISLQKKT